MAIVVLGVVQHAQLWAQGDIRDPLGVWGARVGATGDATGGSIKARIEVPAPQRAAYVHTCYSVNIARLTGLTTTETAKTRLLTNWPNISPEPGVQAYGSLFLTPWTAPVGLTSPIGGYATNYPLGPFDRFLLLYDPRSGINLPLTIAELEINDNILAETYAFEAYGYFWDRSVMDAPGGPRHPGSS